MKAFFIASRALKKSLSDLSKSISLRNHPFKGTTATDAKDFQAPQAGRIVRTAQGHPAFVPAPLPPRLDYFDLGTVYALTRADAAISGLSGLGRIRHLLMCARSGTT
jgi:hypothetical protein